jgi:hypothetical protein
MSNIQIRLLHLTAMLYTFNQTWPVCELPEDDYIWQLKHVGVPYTWYKLCSKLEYILSVYI